MPSPKRLHRIAKPAKPKKLSEEAALGQLGVNLIERIVTEMGSRWTPSNSLEVGIDGYIELFDPLTRNPLGLHLSVQSKAVSRFAGDSDVITFSCKRDDIDYWRRTAPRVILVVSEPKSSGEAYWLSVPTFFGSESATGTTTAVFDKRTSRFTAASYDALLEAARTGERAPARSPVSVAETLHTNLFPLESHPATIFVAAATCGGYEAAWARLRTGADEYPPRGWALRENMLFSFTDPSTGLLSRIVDAGTVEEHDAREWATAKDTERQRVFVEMLNGSLQDDLGAIGVRFFSDDRIFAFKGTHERAPRSFQFRNLRRESSVTVVSRYVSRSKAGREYAYLRHAAFRGRFRRLDGCWFLEVTPTYRFTSDGINKYRFHENQLAGIKRLEGNRAVLSQVLLWNEVLSGQPTLFDKHERLLRFGARAAASLNCGIPDADWAPASDDTDDSATAPLLDLITQSGKGPS